MRKGRLLMGILCMTLQLFAQSNKKETGVFTGPFTQPLNASISSGPGPTLSWNIEFQSMPNEADENLLHVRELKALQKEAKLASVASFSSNKTTAVTPVIGKNFKGNQLRSWTPTDNTLAISDSGYIVSCINYNIDFYDTSGNQLQSKKWNDFVPDTTLKSGKFDPRVIYDRVHDRFIVVLLHGTSPSTSRLLLFFSKTFNPMDGWYFYTLSGNPYNDTSWTDYPTIGITDDDLFVNGNAWGDAPDYPYKGTYIYQVGLSEGYAGASLSYGLWNQIYTPDSLVGVTLYPASHGQGLSMKDKMYFVQLQPDSGAHVYLYEINGKLSSPSKSMSGSMYAIPQYTVCADAYQKDPVTGFVDSLSTGSSWTQNAFYLPKVVHFTFDAAMPDHWCGLHYGRIYLDSNKAVVSSFGETGTDFCYPAVASLGYDTLDQSVGIAYVRSDTLTTKTPETGVISLDHAMTWSSKQTVKAGDTSVNILYPPDYPIMPERWGDYTGIARRFNAALPTVWMAGAYGANTPPRNNSYGTWIAEIKTGEGQVVPVQDVAATPTSMVLYPNPGREQFTLEFDNTEDGFVRIDLFDMNGRKITCLFEDQLRKSRNRISFNTRMLSSGTYMVVVSRSGGQILSEKLDVK